MKNKTKQKYIKKKLCRGFLVLYFTLTSVCFTADFSRSSCMYSERDAPTQSPTSRHLSRHPLVKKSPITHKGRMETY